MKVGFVSLRQKGLGFRISQIVFCLAKLNLWKIEPFFWTLP